MAFDTLRGMGPLRSVPAEYRRRGYFHTVSWAFYGVFFAAVLSHGPFVIRQLGGPAWQCLLVNYGRAIPLLFALLYVPFVERRNPVRLTGLLLSLGGLLVVFSGLARSTMSLALILAAGTLLTFLCRPTLGTVLEQVYPTRWRGKLYSLPLSANMLVRLVCLMWFGRLLEKDIASCRWIFPAAGGALVVGGVVFRAIGGSRGGRGPIEQRGRSALRQIRGSLRATFRNRMLLVFLLGYFVSACGGVAHANALPLFARDSLGLTPGQWGYASAGYMAAMLVSFYL